MDVLRSNYMKYLYTVLFIIVHQMVAAQEADFEFRASGGSSFCDPQRIVFTQTSSGNPVSFVWNFGNGTTGNQPTEEVTYLNPGTYTVKLIAIYNNVAITKEKQITIHSTPSLSLRAGQRDLCAPGIVTFTASGSNDIVSYQWNFGDGSNIVSTTTPVIQHNFENFGTYQIQVKASNSFGCQVAANVSVNISPLAINADIDITSGCIPATANLNVNGSYLTGDTPAQIIWNLGDGTILPNSTSNINHTYTTTQTVTPSVKVVTQNGCEAEINLSPVSFGTSPSTPVINTVNGDTTFCGSEEVSLIAASNGASHYVWDFGDNATDSLDRNTIDHKFRKLGELYVKVTPYHNGCAGTIDSFPLNIIGVIAKFDIKNLCEEKNNYSFKNRTLGNISSCTWNYGSLNSTVIEQNTLNGAYVYPSVTSSFVQLIVRDDVSGCADSLKRNIYTALPSFEADRYAVCKDSSITYSVINDYPAEANIKYSYFINDRIIRNRETNTYTYNPTFHGIYNDFVVLSDAYTGTCNDTLYLNNPIKVRGPIVNFEAPSFVCYDSTLLLNNLSYPYFTDEPIQNWEWKIGNDLIIHAAQPEPISFMSPGTYPVRLTVTDVSGCAQTTAQSVLIKRLPKIDILPRLDTICADSQIELIAYTSDHVQWLDLPSSICITCDTVVVRPQTSGAFTAQTTDAYGCKNFTSSLIEVVTPQTVQVSPADTTICAGSSFNYQVNTPGTVQFTPAIYLTDPTGHSPYAFPAEDVQYTVAVTDTLGCFTDTAIVSVKVRPNPVLNAGEDIRVGYGEEYRITPVATGSGLQYTWTSSAGNISCTQCSYVTGTATDNVTYMVEVKDSYGCKSSDNISVWLDCNTKQLLIPNAFTPNNDGLNDFFYPIAKGYNEIKSFAIYNRLGVKVFEKKNMTPNIPSNGWNGLINGTKPSTQTFVWIAQVECEGETITRKGSFTLIR